MAKLYDIDTENLSMGLESGAAKPVVLVNNKVTQTNFQQVSVVKMSDSSGPTQFLRHFYYESGTAVSSYFDTDLEGAPYTVTGTETFAL